MMTLMTFVYFAQIAGSIALILTLIFVGVQVRQHTVAARAATFQSSVEFWTRFYTDLMEANANAAFAKGASGSTELNSAEFSRFYIVCRNALLGAENSLFQYREGLMDKDAFLGSNNFFRENVLSTPGFLAMWKLTRSNYGLELRTFIDEQIATSPKRGQTSMRERWHVIVANTLEQKKGPDE